MKEFLIQVVASALGYCIYTYIHGFIFAYFKADKYENSLEAIVYKSCKKALKRRGGLNGYNSYDK